MMIFFGRSTGTRHGKQRTPRAFSYVGAAFMVAVLSLFSSAATAQNSPGPLNGKFYGNGGDVLFVSLHGDLSNGANAEYQYGIARRVSQANRSVTAFGLIRPGYRDDAGRTSPGSNNGRGNHYTAANNRLVAQTIQNLKASTGASYVVALGHSGGAAQIGTIIGSHPGLIDLAVLVSCPCDVPRWRQMKNRRAWSSSQSPQAFVRRVPSTTRVIAITGANDNNTFPVLARNYVASLQRRGVRAEFYSVNGAGHSYSGSFRQQVERLVNQQIAAR